MRHFIEALAVSLALALFVPAAASAQENGASVQFSLLDIQNLTVSKIIDIDKDYTDQYGGNAPAPFRLYVPQTEGITPLYKTPEEGFDTLIEVIFATEDRQLVENIRFTPMTIALGPLDERQQTMLQLMRDNVFAGFTNGYDDVHYVGARATKVNTYDAVEVLGLYTDPEFGKMYLRIVGILNPDSEKTVFAIANVASKYLSLPTPDDFDKTRTGYMLSKFEFLPQ
ncbi:MAG: hypothetical protein KDJ19_09900 [Hyphomicrobiaceae bacterium]|nr:hypothetical protein [Hyphomicrobiaceae bacterium]MCC0023193.1 hypothetical protein [Hyphomicrobiaceae bacterium]